MRIYKCFSLPDSGFSVQPSLHSSAKKFNLLDFVQVKKQTNPVIGFRTQSNC